MIAYVLVYTFLATLMGAIVFVIGTPWSIPRPREDKSERSISNDHR